MPTIIFESEDSAPTSVEFAGGRLADLCDSVEAPVPFSCRSANCGTCRIHVLEGAELLSEAEDEELDVLDVFAVGPPSQRLACQVKVRAGAGVLRVKAVSDSDEE